MSKYLAMAGFTAIALTGCGGGSGEASSAVSTNSVAGSGTGNTQASVPAGAIALFAPTGAPASNFVASGDVTNDTLGYMNDQRAQLGLPALHYSAVVSKASANHAAYMQLNGLVTHTESPGAPGYTGVSPTDRVTAVYPTLSVGEIAAGFGGAFAYSTEPIEALFDAPFHRTIITFDIATAGIGVAATTDPTKYSTLDVNLADYQAFVPDNRLIAYPYSGQTNVKTSWVANESPNPMANAPSYIGKVVGYPVTLSASGAGAFSGIAFRITDAQGQPVPCQETDNTTSDEALRMAVCVPFAPLAANAAYTVTVSGSLTNTTIATPAPFSVSWTFTTAAKANVPIGAPASNSADGAGLSVSKRLTALRPIVLD